MRTYSKGDEPAPGFRLIQVLGRGGFGEVWKATAPGGTEVAIKIINLGNRQGFKEFRAVRLVKQIRHPNLVPIIAFWLKDEKGNLLDDLSKKDDSFQGGNQANELIIAMGLGDKNLLDRLKECQTAGKTGVPKDELIDYMEESAKAIDHLNQATHDLGSGPVAIQHCDIKPQNILIVGGSAQVCDFGLARVLEDTHVSAAAGSLAYMAPELFTENKPSKSSDQYSLAISYYQLRTGVLPLDATAPGSTIWAHVEGKLDFSKVPPAEQPILKRGTALDPNGRFPTTVEMVRELRHAHDSKKEGSTTRPPGAKVVQTGSEIVPGFTLQHLIGKGSYGEVWQAAAPGGRPVALKIIKNLANTQGKQEYNALELIKGVDHNHLLELQAYWLLDVEGNVIPDNQRGQPGTPPAAMLVMASKLASKNLLQRLQECQQAGHAGIPLPELLLYMRQAADAIDYLNSPQHALSGQKVSIQHRDIKPENILLAAKTVKVGDFSLAKVLEGTSALVNEDTGGLTMGYAPPELFKGSVSSRTDQYSLAITYVKLRTGGLPFPPGTSPYQMIQCHVDGKLDLSSLAAPERVVIARATRVKPEERYANCLDMVRALEDACAPEHMLTVPPGSDMSRPGGDSSQGSGAPPRKKKTDPPPNRPAAGTGPTAPPGGFESLPPPPRLRNPEPPVADPLAPPAAPSKPSGRKSDPPVAKPYSPPPGRGSSGRMPAAGSGGAVKPKPAAAPPAEPPEEEGTIITDKVPQGLVRTKVEKPLQPPTEWEGEPIPPTLTDGSPAAPAPPAREKRVGPPAWQVRASRLWRKYRRVGIGIVVLLLLGVAFATVRHLKTSSLRSDVDTALARKDFPEAFRLVDGTGGLFASKDDLKERIIRQAEVYLPELTNQNKNEEALALAELVLQHESDDIIADEVRTKANLALLPGKITELLGRTPPEFKQAAELLRKLPEKEREALQAQLLALWRQAARERFSKGDVEDGLRLCGEIQEAFTDDAETAVLRKKYEPLTRKAIENEVTLATADLIEGGEKVPRAKEHFDAVLDRLKELPDAKYPDLRRQAQFGLVRVAARQKDWAKVRLDLPNFAPQSDEEKACVAALAVLAEDAAKNVQDRPVLDLLKQLREPTDLREWLKKPARLAWENEQIRQVLNGLAARVKDLPPEKGLDLAGEVLAFDPNHVEALAAKAEKQIALGKLDEAEVTLKRAQDAGGAENAKVVAAYALWKDAKGVADYKSQIDRAHVALQKGNAAEAHPIVEALAKAKIPDTDQMAHQQVKALKALLAAHSKKPEARAAAFGDLVELLKLASPPFHADLAAAVTKLALDDPTKLDAAIKALEDTAFSRPAAKTSIDGNLVTLRKAQANREFTERVAKVRELRGKKDVEAALKKLKEAVSGTRTPDRDTDLELKALRALLLSEKPNRSPEETTEALQKFQELLAEESLPAGANRVDLCRGVADLAETLPNPSEARKALAALARPSPEESGFYLFVSALEKEKSDKPAAAADLFKCFGTEPKLPLVFQEPRRQQHAALIFQEVAAELRAKGTLKNPFGTDANAEKVHGWLQKCQDLFAKENLTLELRANLALASYYRAGADAAAARKQVLDVLQAPEAMDLGGMTTALLLVKAEKEDNTPQGHAAALKDYKDILDRAQKEATEEIPPVDLYQVVIGPAIKRGQELLTTDSGDEVKKQVAFFHARKGKLLVNHQDEPWDEFNKKPIDEAIKAYDEAITLDPSNARYLVGKASAGILLLKPDLKQLTEVAEKAVQTDTNYVSARRLLGDLYLRQSRKTPEPDGRVSLLDRALEQTEAAIKLCKDADPERERPTLLLNRSMIGLELANFRQSKAEAYLEQAREDADAAVLANKRYPWYAYEALGNALEDMGMFLGQKGKYSEAIGAFDKASKIRRDRPVSFVSLGRCQYRAVLAGEQSPDSLKQAETDLRAALAKDGPHTAEAHYWQGMVHLYRAQTQSNDSAARSRHRGQAREAFKRSIQAAKDHEVLDWMANALAQQSSLYLDDARKLWVRKPEEANQFLDTARDLAVSLKAYSPALGAYRMAEVYLIQDKFKEAIDECTRAIPVDPKQWSQAHVELLANRMLLLCRPDLPQSVRGDRTYASLVQEADQILTIAAGSQHEAFATGTAGLARFYAGYERGIAAARRREYWAKAVDQLRTAIDKAPKNHPEGWHWRFGLAFALQKEFIPTETESSQKEKWRTLALKSVNEALAGTLPDDVTRDNIESLKKDLESSK